MGTQIIEYSYSGDESEWKANIDEFFAHLKADPILKDGLSYSVYIRADGVSRVHVPAWRDQAVLDHMLKQSFFEAFSKNVNRMANGTIKVTKPALVFHP